MAELTPAFPRAAANLDRLLQDAELHGIEVLEVGPLRPRGGPECVEFLLHLGERNTVALMPDLPLEALRWLPGDDFLHQRPRVGLEGLWWDWPFAVDIVASALTGADDDQPATLLSLYEELWQFHASQEGWREAEAQLGSLAG